MSSSNTIRKCIVFLLLANLIIIWANHFFNTHYHFHPNGELISHAHPHEHNQEHHHSEDEFYWLDNISHPKFQSADFLDFDFQINYVISVENIEAPESEFSKFSFQLLPQRGPPYKIIIRS